MYTPLVQQTSLKFIQNSYVAISHAETEIKLGLDQLSL